jgi:hypothetical protein
MLVKSNFIPASIFNKFLLTNEILKDKPITVFNDYVPSIDELNQNPYNILILNEPNELFGLHDWAINNRDYFSCILNWNDIVLNKCENAILFPFGMSSMWEDRTQYEKIKIQDKEFRIFFVCGEKAQTAGHIFRHEVYKLKGKLNISHNWIHSCHINEKNENFKNNMFHVAVENVKSNNFFTEKIIDCFLTKTIPIYCGCPNIGDFFDERGIITFSSVDELVYIIENISADDFQNRKEAIEKNYLTAVYWSKYFERLVYFLEELVKINKL